MVVTTCSARRFHVPAAPFPDSHHVVPRAWQAFWRPSPPAGALEHLPLPLWHPETVEVCPNCHRRVHVAIQQLMKSKPDLVEDPLDYRRNAWGLHRMNREQTIAYRALTAWAEVGGSLDALVRNRLFGIQ